MNFAIVTAHNAAYQPLADITWDQNKKLYANRHGYDALALTEFKYPLQQISFERTEYIISLLESGKYDWVYAVGGDTMITNFTTKLEDLIDEDYDFIIGVDCLGINNDSFLARATPLTIAWLKKVVSLKDSYMSARWLDQSAMVDTIDMMGDKIKIVPHRFFNSYDYWQYPQDYQPHIDKVDIFGNDGQWQPGDFLIHWPGIKLDKRIELAKEKLTQVIQ
jgi:mannan polymerase II complex MNN10 subunit